MYIWDEYSVDQAWCFDLDVRLVEVFFLNGKWSIFHQMPHSLWEWKHWGFEINLPLQNTTFWPILGVSHYLSSWALAQCCFSIALLGYCWRFSGNAVKYQSTVVKYWSLCQRLLLPDSWDIITACHLIATKLNVLRQCCIQTCSIVWTITNCGNTQDCRLTFCVWFSEKINDWFNRTC